MRNWTAILVLSLLASMLAGCLSDNGYFQRASRRERASRIVGMKAAMRQTPRGQPVAGDQLRQLLAGRTHEEVLGSFPNGQKGRYVTDRYYRADGKFLMYDAWLMRDLEPQGDDHWRVEDDRLCVLHAEFDSAEACYRVALQADGKIQFYIAEPGDDTDGLLTSIVEIVIDGPPRAR